MCRSLISKWKKEVTEIIRKESSEQSDVYVLFVYFKNSAVPNSSTASSASATSSVSSTSATTSSVQKDEVTSEMIIQDEQELSEAEITAMYYVFC